MLRMSFVSKCPHCGRQMNCLDHHQGTVIQCRHCKLAMIAGQEGSAKLRCPRCGSSSVGLGTEKFSTAGQITAVLGICALPAYGAGIVLLIISLFMRDMRFPCKCCRNWF